MKSGEIKHKFNSSAQEIDSLFFLSAHDHYLLFLFPSLNKVLAGWQST